MIWSHLGTINTYYECEKLLEISWVMFDANPNSLIFSCILLHDILISYIAGYFYVKRKCLALWCTYTSIILITSRSESENNIYCNILQLKAVLLNMFVLTCIFNNQPNQADYDVFSHIYLKLVNKFTDILQESKHCAG